MNDYLTKHNIQIVMRSNLQTYDSQDVYTTTFAVKIFRIFMTLMTAYHLKTRQLNTINAFLNAHNDELIYCQMSNDYRLNNKVLIVIRNLYE